MLILFWSVGLWESTLPFWSRPHSVLLSFLYGLRNNTENSTILYILRTIYLSPFLKGRPARNKHSLSQVSLRPAHIRTTTCGEGLPFFCCPETASRPAVHWYVGGANYVCYKSGINHSMQPQREVALPWYLEDWVLRTFSESIRGVSQYLDGVY